MGYKSPAWEDGRLEQAIERWSAGHTADQIAKALKHGLTRSSVLGKMHRLGLTNTDRVPKVREVTKSREPKRYIDTETLEREILTIIKGAGEIDINTEAIVQQLIIRGYTVERSHAKRICRAILSQSQPDEASEIVPLSARITLVKLTPQSCRWPIGDVGEDNFRFCGKDHEPGSPYCTNHSLRAFQPVSEQHRLNYLRRISEPTRQRGHR